MKKRLIVFSADAMVCEDLPYLATLPNFRRYFGGYAQAESLRSIYPTITYPVHTTLMTGLYPKDHGVISNDQLVAGETNRPWHWFREELQGRDLFTAAKEAGLTTAAVFWPCTGRHPHIDYLIDEYWTQSSEESLEDAFRRAGSSPDVLNIIRRHAAVTVERQHPMCDDFALRCACDILREYAPELLMVHPANIDGYRHRTGLFNEHVRDGIAETDAWLGQLALAAKEAGVLEETNFVLLSDHGQMEIKRTINLNVLLRDAGLLETDESGKLLGWQAFAFSGGMLAYVRLREPGNKALFDRVHALLLSLRDEGVYGIGEVFTREEILEKEHLDGDFSFVLETDGYTSFGERALRPLVSNFDLSDYRFGRATHGYLPDKGPQPVFLAKGPAFQENARCGRKNAVDVAPTLAKVLGVELPDAQGRAMEELLI